MFVKRVIYVEKKCIFILMCVVENQRKRVLMKYLISDIGLQPEEGFEVVEISSCCRRARVKTSNYFSIICVFQLVADTTRRELNF